METMMGDGRALSVALGLLLLMGLGCSHSEPARVTGTPEALALAEQLKGVNGPPPSVSATFVFETHQPRRSAWAEQCYGGSDAASQAKILKNESPDYLTTRRIEQKQQGIRRVVSETSSEDGKQTGRWDSRDGTYPPVDLKAIGGHALFPAFWGKLSLRREMYGGEECVVIRDESAHTYRETYLSEKDGWLPRKIVVRETFTAPPPATMPTTDQTMTEEWETRKWHFFTNRGTRTWTVPAAAFKELDLNYREYDMDVTVDKWVIRPDGKWFITEATTVWPMFRKTEHFRVENLSFEPIPQRAFESK
jgi:hypothetical protein